MITTTRVTGALVAGMALAGVLAAPASATTPTSGGTPAVQADRHGRDAGTYGSRRACEEAGRSGQRRHWWDAFDCDRRDRNDHGRGRHDRRHSDDEWVLRVYR